MAASSYHFPHRDASFDLILLTSVFTHVLPDELTQYLSEIARLLAPDGVAYASFFLYGSQSATDLAGRHPLKFTFAHEGYSVSREDFPANAVAFEEAFLSQALRQAGLRLIGAPRYGGQDLILITRDENAGSLHLMNGWHELERERWRWTERVFAVRMPHRPAPAAILRFRFTIADAVHKTAGIVKIKASVNDVALQTSEFTTPGEHLYVQDVPDAALQPDGSPLVRFELENAYRTGSDQRELGVQVSFWATCNDARRALHPIEIA
jgi:SAM-dependent methyltransferase